MFANSVLATFPCRQYGAYVSKKPFVLGLISGGVSVPSMSVEKDNFSMFETNALVAGVVENGAPIYFVARADYDNCPEMSAARVATTEAERAATEAKKAAAAAKEAEQRATDLRRAALDAEQNFVEAKKKCEASAAASRESGERGLAEVRRLRCEYFNAKAEEKRALAAASRATAKREELYVAVQRAIDQGRAAADECFARDVKLTHDGMRARLHARAAADAAATAAEEKEAAIMAGEKAADIAAAKIAAAEDAVKRATDLAAADAAATDVPVAAAHCVPPGLVAFARSLADAVGGADPPAGAAADPVGILSWDPALGPVPVFPKGASSEEISRMIHRRMVAANAIGLAEQLITELCPASPEYRVAMQCYEALKKELGK